MTMATTMLLPLALLLIVTSNVSSFRSASHATLQVSPFGVVSGTQQRVPLPPLFRGKDDEDDVDISDAMDEVEEALKAAAEALGESPAEPTPPTSP
jgi:hypothetical protein